jgi:hypothetical protein
MSVHATYQDIQHELAEIRKGEWRWSFTPPTGAPRTGRVVGEYMFAVGVVRRAIEVWHLMNRQDRSHAA